MEKREYLVAVTSETTVNMTVMATSPEEAQGLAGKDLLERLDDAINEGKDTRTFHVELF